MIRLVITSMLVAVLFMSVVGARSASADTMQVTAGIGLNVRSGPGLEYSILTAMPYGTPVTTGEWAGEWVQVTYAGVTGWSHGGWLMQTASAATTQAVGGDSGGYASACTWAWGYQVCAEPYIVEAIYSAAATHGVSGDWLFSVAACESNFNPGIVGAAGEIGLFQFLPSTFYTYGGGDIWSVWDQSYTAASMFAQGLSWHWACA